MLRKLFFQTLFMINDLIIFNLISNHSRLFNFGDKAILLQISLLFTIMIFEILQFVKIYKY